MFTLLDRNQDHNCQGYSRREFLKIGSLGFAGLTLPNLLAAKARAAAEGKSLTTDKSVVFLFLHGGPPHIEMFDPKMSAPEEVRNSTGEVQTCLPGYTFGGTFPQLAKIADQLAIVRSYASGNADHSYGNVASGGNSLKAAMSSIYARVAGANSKTGMPNNVLVLPEAVQSGLKLGGNFETSALPTLTASGELGPAFTAFDPSGGGQVKKNMELKISPERLEDRRGLLQSLDTIRRDVDRLGILETSDKFQQQAFDVITRGVADAFDLSKEDPKTIDRYDTSKLFKLEEATKWFDMKRSTNLLGKQMLMARRLVEAGCGFVTVSDCGWDMHSNNNSPKNLGGLQWLGRQVDHAVAAFVEDLKERGLSDKVLLVVTGEMGRTPKRNRDGGRDHYANLTSLLLAGGGLKMGQVIGQSDRNASAPATERFGPQNLLATIMNTVLNLPEVRVQPGLGRIGDALLAADPIVNLF